MATAQDQAAIDAANAAKFSTPAVPNDPASQRGVRSDPNYIGATNFAELQKKYTPYQIEQSTTRNSTGDIFWKSGVNIADIPTAAPAVPFKAPAASTTMSTSNLAPSAAPDVNVTRTSSPIDAFATAQSQASGKYLDGIQGSIDNLLAQQQKMATDAKAAAEAENTGLKNRLTSIMNGGATSYQKTLDDAREKFKIDESVKTLGIIQQKIADASAALDQGLIYEQSQPVRMALLTGRSAELKKQGIASIGALQSAAEVVKGNIELGRAYASDTIAAIKQDNAEKMSALNTLLDLSNSKLVQLTKDEKDLIDRRMGLLSDESKRIDQQKDQVFDLATKYPQAFSTGGVTFTDTPEQALAKMLPLMSKQEKEKYDLDILKTKASIAKTSSGGGSGGGGSSSSNNLASEIAADIAYGRQLGWSNEKIRQSITQEYAGKFKKQNDLFSILDNNLNADPKTTTDPSKELDNLLAKNSIDKLNSGSAEIQYKDGKPIVVPVDKADSQGFFSRQWDRAKNFFSW